MNEQCFGETFKVFNNNQKVVANFQYTETQKDDYASVTLELAPLSGRNADWEMKMAVQLTRYELTAFAKVLFGLEQIAEGAYHGANRNKGFRLFNNGSNGVGLSISEAGRSYSIALSPQERTELGAFFIRRLADGWKMAVTDVLAILRQGAAMERQFSQVR